MTETLARQMGSLETPTSIVENSSRIPNMHPDEQKPASNGGDPAWMTPELEAMRRQRASMLPLEVGTHIMCHWRDGKFHPVNSIVRQKPP
jgi:histone acetyltransferase MYST1